MSQESNAGLRRTEGGLASALSNLTVVSHQPRHSEHLVGHVLQQCTDLWIADLFSSVVIKQRSENSNVTSGV